MGEIIEKATEHAKKLRKEYGSVNDFSYLTLDMLDKSLFFRQIQNSLDSPGAGTG